MDRVKSETVIRNLRADDCARLVKMDAQITGRTREVWFEGKLRRALREMRVAIEQDLKKLGDELEAAGAPWTPGRGVPRWKKR